MITAKEANNFYEQSNTKTVEEKVNHHIMCEALAGVKAILFNKKEFGKTEKQQSEMIEKLKENGFSINISSFDKDDIFVEF